jgi:hypothetical protein
MNSRTNKGTEMNDKTRSDLFKMTAEDRKWIADRKSEAQRASEKSYWKNRRADRWTEDIRAADAAKVAELVAKGYTKRAAQYLVRSAAK